jgi:hypothetical protein
MQDQAFNVAHVLTGIDRATYGDYVLNPHPGGVLGRWMQEQSQLVVNAISAQLKGKP